MSMEASGGAEAVDAGQNQSQGDIAVSGTPNQQIIPDQGYIHSILSFCFIFCSVDLILGLNTHFI